MSETSAIPSLLFSHAGIGAGKAFFGGHNHDGTELVFVRRGHCESVFSREQNSRESLRLTAGVPRSVRHSAAALSQSDQPGDDRNALSGFSGQPRVVRQYAADHPCDGRTGGKLAGVDRQTGR